MSVSAAIRQRRVFRSRMGKRKLSEPEVKAQKRKFVGFLVKLFEVTAAGVMLTAGYHLSLTHPYFDVKKIVVDGEKQVMEGDVYGAVNRYLRGNVFLVDTEAAKTSVVANPWIKEADVYRVLPNTIKVRITERRPVAVLSTESRSFLMDEEGYLLERSMDESGFVKITGVHGDFKPGDRIDINSIESAVTIYRLFKNDSLFSDPVVSMEFLETRQIAASTRGGVRLVFGPDPSMWEEKFLEYLTVRKILADKGESYEHLDLSFRDKVVVALGGEKPVETETIN